MKASNYPKYIVVREATGITLDPVNIIFEIDMEEIAAVLSRDGWQQAYIENPAYLEDRKPLATYEKRIVGMVVRYHMRLWLFDVGDVYIGNAHLDMPWLTGHRSYHNVGRDYVAKLFLAEWRWRCGRRRRTSFLPIKEAKKIVQSPVARGAG